MDRVSRTEIQECQRLLEWIKLQAHLGIEQGRAKDKKSLRIALTKSCVGLTEALEEIEMNARRT